MCCLVVLLIGLLLATASDAAVVDLSLTRVEQTALTGYRTFDVTVSGSGQLTGLQMLLETTQGEIYQDPVGSSLPPNELWFDYFPTVEFDTFVGLGGATAETSASSVIVAGGAVNLGGSSATQFDASVLNITWAPQGAMPVFDPSEFFVARVTLSDDAHARVKLLASTFGEPDYLSEQQIFPKLVHHEEVVGSPPSGSTISLQPALDDGTGVLPQAITLTDRSSNAPLTSLDIIDLYFMSDEHDLLAASVNALDRYSIDLGIDLERSAALPQGTPVRGDLVVRTAGGSTLKYRVTAVLIPEPTALLIALPAAGLWLSRRRQSVCG